MLEQPFLQLLRDCRTHLRYLRLASASARALLRRIDALIIANQAAIRFGSAIVAHARSAAHILPGVSIDENEAEIRPHPSGAQVRAWLLVPTEAIAFVQHQDPKLEIALAQLGRRTREVLILRTRHGFSPDDIAARLQMSRREVRRHLRRGIEVIVSVLDGAGSASGPTG